MKENRRLKFLEEVFNATKEFEDSSWRKRALRDKEAKPDGNRFIAEMQDLYDRYPSNIGRNLIKSLVEFEGFPLVFNSVSIDKISRIIGDESTRALLERINRAL